MALTELGKSWFDPTQVENVVIPTPLNIRGRYDDKVQMRMKNSDLMIRNLRISDIYIKESEGDSVHKVTAGEEYRPDIIAFNQYKDAQLAWVILSANNMKSIFELTVDTVIRIPEITSLYGSGGVLANE